MQTLNVLQSPQFDAAKASKLQVLKTDQLALDALFLRPGQIQPQIRLPEKDRSFVVVQGQGDLVLGTVPQQQIIKLEPGVVALAPRGVWHSVHNTSGSDMVVVMASEFPARVEDLG